MSYCINPDCPNPTNALNKDRNICDSCHLTLDLQGYRAVRLLRENDFSQIYEVKKGTAMRVLKVTPTRGRAGSAANNPEREAEVLQQLSHEGIPKVDPHGYFVLNPQESRKLLHCLMMEKFEGPTLQEWLTHNTGAQLSTRELIDWFKQLLKILSYLHGQGYVHRDIKPENILVRSHDRLGLVDFGSVRKLDHTFALDMGNEENSAVTTCRSEGYTPPEQKRGCPTQQSDFFALARTIVHLMTGVHPTYLEDEYGNFKWRDRAPSVPEFIADLLDNMMAYKPKDRPANTQIILQRLEGEAQPTQLDPLLQLLRSLPSIQVRKLAVIGLSTTSVLVTSVAAIFYRSFTQSAPSSFSALSTDSPGDAAPLCNNRSCIGRDPKDNACAPANNDVVKTVTSVLVNSEQQPGKTFRLELRYSPLCDSTWVRSWSPPGSFHYLQDTSGQEYGGAEVKNDASLPHQFSDMGPSDRSLRACIRQPLGKTTCTNYISPPFELSKS
jgi:serine/threonine protein kinase